MESRTRLAPGIIVTGVIAGAVGAVLIDAYLLLTLVALAHRTTVNGFYEYVASAAIGKDAYQSNFVALGVVMHVVVSVLWGVGYAFVAVRTLQLRTRPATSGIAFGIVVMLAMQLVEVSANVYELPDTFSLVNAFVAHTLFFGVPIAYIVTRRLGPG